ncbi:hypothetical protein PROPEN_00213 [Proteus penneri ATCC 35198]|nr:hypothetical protein PROPEN_00213 [Proteus penneri ATCC 35198]
MGVKGGGALIVVVTLLVIRYQHNQISRLSEQNSQLEYQQSTLQSQLVQWHQQAEKNVRNINASTKGATLFRGRKSCDTPRVTANFGSSALC